MISSLTHFMSLLKNALIKIPSAGEDVGKGESWCTVCRNANWHNHYKNNGMEFSQKLKIKQLYNTLSHLWVYIQRR